MIKTVSLGRYKWVFKSISGHEVSVTLRENNLSIIYQDVMAHCPHDSFVIGGWEDTYYPQGHEECRSTISLGMRHPNIDISLFSVNLDFEELEHIKRDIFLSGFLQVSIIDTAE
jgi:hypothetical protein